MAECNKCGKSMTSANGTSVIALSISILMEGTSKEVADLIMSSLGKYSTLVKDNKVKFDFCYECWLDSLLGGKE